MQGSREHHGSGATLRCSTIHRNQYLSDQIAREISRFESVHPCIYTVYDLIENISNPELQDNLRDQILNIEDAFVNSQEWTLCRTVNDIRLGVVGSLDSGKTSLVHYYLTGAFNAEANAEGGRFKKEVVVNGRSNLLLIREEGSSSPSTQFTQWLDGVLIVYTVDSRESFNIALSYYKMMNQYRVMSGLPVILVGTQDGISSASPRVVSEDEGRSAALRYNMQNYVETNATFGFKVNEVFKEAYEGIIQLRSSMSRVIPAAFQDVLHIADCNSYHQRSMSSHIPYRDGVLDQRGSMQLATDSLRSSSKATTSSSYHAAQGQGSIGSVAPAYSHNNLASQNNLISNNTYFRSSSSLHPQQLDQWSVNTNDLYDGNGMLASSVTSTSSLQQAMGTASSGNLPTPTSTPTAQRKNRRISHLFRSAHKDNGNSENRKSNNSAECNVGSGRLIPIKQGTLYKRSNKALNREWKKKYVCLHANGRLTYHQNIRDYMGNASGKEVFLGLATVRLSTRNRTKSKSKPATVGPTGATTNGKENMNPPGSAESGQFQPSNSTNGVSGPNGDATSGASDDQQFAVPSLANSSFAATSMSTPVTVPSSKASKKKHGHRRMSSMGVGKNDDEEDTEFEIITNDQKHWEFSAASSNERDQWVTLIEQQIEKSLQAQMSQKQLTNRAHCSQGEVMSLCSIPGNNFCADCQSPNPIWASINLGTLICIQCSGIHRNMGSHISKVRSLELDEWPVEYVAVLRAIGNELANRVWEHNAPKDRKPHAGSPKDVIENWIRMKYEKKRFLPPLPVNKTLNAQLMEAVIQRNMSSLLNILPRCSEKDINAPLSSTDKRTALHLACSSGSVEVLQLLIWYNADVNVLDEKGRSALWHAEQNGTHDCKDMLIHAGITIGYGIPESESAMVVNRTVKKTYSDLSEEQMRFRQPEYYGTKQDRSHVNDFDDLSTSAI